MLLLLACTQDVGRHFDGEYPSSSDATDTDTDTDDPTTPQSEDTATGGELRAAWVTRWSFSSASDIEAIFDDLEAGGLNAAYFQVRGNHDAYYDSAHEPWAAGLGSLGVDPGWDPLQSAIDAGHARGIEVHAYLNVGPFWSGSTAPASSGIPHPYEEHPEWVVHDESGTPMALNSSYVYVSLGNPEVREHLAAVAADIDQHYAVDGLHLDYIRYPGSQYSHDAASEAAFAASSGLPWEDWQREQVKEAVAGVSAAVDIPVTAAVWGVHTNEWGWSSVSQGDADYYQDSRAFLQEGLLDANVPMIYWPVTDPAGERLDFRTLIDDHVSYASGRHVYAGLGPYELDYDQTIACVEAAREAGAHGVVFFDWSNMDGWWDQLREDVFSEPAAVPTMSWR